MKRHRASARGRFPNSCALRQAPAEHRTAAFQRCCWKQPLPGRPARAVEKNTAACFQGEAPATSQKNASEALILKKRIICSNNSHSDSSEWMEKYLNIWHKKQEMFQCFWGKSQKKKSGMWFYCLKCPEKLLQNSPTWQSAFWHGCLVVPIVLSCSSHRWKVWMLVVIGWPIGETLWTVSKRCLKLLEKTSKSSRGNCSSVGKQRLCWQRLASVAFQRDHTVNKAAWTVLF